MAEAMQEDAVQETKKVAVWCEAEGCSQRFGGRRDIKGKKVGKAKCRCGAVLVRIQHRGL